LNHTRRAVESGAQLVGSEPRNPLVIERMVAYGIAARPLRTNEAGIELGVMANHEEGGGHAGIRELREHLRRVGWLGSLSEGQRGLLAPPWVAASGVDGTIRPLAGVRRDAVDTALRRGCQVSGCGIERLGECRR